MKNLMIYISDSKSFNNPRPDITANDAGVSFKVQIENSLQLGWKKEDIIVVTNFPCEYAGIKPIVLDDVEFFDRKPQASKINAIIKLFEEGLIENKETYWFHDLDAFQTCSRKQLAIDLERCDMALSDYGVASRWSTGVIYFNKNAKDIFVAIREVMYKKNIDEERALTFLTKNNKHIDKRIMKISKSYNFTPRCLKSMYKTTLKPVRVLHFHPQGLAWRGSKDMAINYFNGGNQLGITAIPEDLLKLFKYHRVI